jgi:hypothetical protein
MTQLLLQNSLYITSVMERWTADAKRLASECLPIRDPAPLLSKPERKDYRSRTIWLPKTNTDPNTFLENSAGP